MASRTESIEALRSRLLDPSRATGGARTLEVIDLGRAVDMAVSRYSKDRPRSVTASFSGSASHYYPIETYLPNWVRGFSVIQTVDYPASLLSDNSEPHWLDWRDYEVYQTATDTEYVYFPVHTPGTAETVRVYHSTLHIHNDDTDTVYAGDLEAVRDLAASVACEMLATRVAGSRDSSIGADSVNYRDGQLRYTQEAKAWLEKYKSALGLPLDGSPKSAGIIVAMPSERRRREGYLFHGN